MKKLTPKVQQAELASAFADFTIKELKVIKAFALSEVAKELHKMKKETLEEKEQKKRLKESVKYIDYFKESMKSDRKNVIEGMLTEMLEEPLDENLNLDYYSNVSIIYHLDNDLYVKLSDLVYEVNSKISKM